MKVDGTGFTPMHLQQSGQINRSQPNEFKQQIAKTDLQALPQKAEKAVSSKALVSTQQSTSVQQSTAVQKSESSMSAYLNSEEKQMLNMLFPPSGRDFGMRAYQQVQRPAHNPESVGKNLDVLA